MKSWNIDKRQLAALFFAFFLFGAGLRLINVWQPVDRASWRESDVSAIARNYYREGMNPLAPRIDWRGDGEGYTEAEFPFLSWLMALFYQVFGVHEVFGRIIAFLFSLGALVVFFKLSSYLLSELNALIAGFFFALSPLPLQIATSLQPDGLMFFLYLLAAYNFIRWLDEQKKSHFIWALTATALAILAKAPAAHIGLFFGLLLFFNFGFSALKDKKLWIFGVFSLLPALLWYLYARNLWLTYGNSLGLSNEHHWAGLYVLTNPAILFNIFRIDLTMVWMTAGVLIALGGILFNSREKSTKICLLWLTAIFVYYFLAAHTASQDWARYYHVVAVAPVALLIGNGLEVFKRFLISQRLFLAFGAMFFTFVLLSLITYFVKIPALFSLELKLSAIFGISLLVIVIFRRLLENYSALSVINPSLNTDFIAGIAVLCFAVTFLYAGLNAKQMLTWEKSDYFECAKTFAPLMKKEGLIVASGGNCFGAAGKPVAYNTSYFFYWLDRKGFNICIEEQNIEKLENFRQRGAKYFVVEKSALQQNSEFGQNLLQKFELLGECEEAYLFDLSNKD